jgi:acyl carrier protein
MILERLKNLLKLVVGDDPRFDAATEQSDIFKDLGLSSVSLLYLVIAIEEEFGVSLSNTNISSFRTVGDICAYLSEHATK